MAGKHVAKEPKPDFPDDFKPKETIMVGGLDRLIRCWETCRGANPGGYGSAVVQDVKGWHPKSTKGITSCSPFTATVCGMIFDKSGSESNTKTYEPMYDGGTVALPSTFYSLHNGFYLTISKDERTMAAQVGSKDAKIAKQAKEAAATIATKEKRQKRFDDMKWPRSADDAVGSMLFFNLGYEISPRDMRRGDLVKIEWSGGGGHATFCWDVHLDDDKAVDCFQYLSSNSVPDKCGVSVSVDKHGLSYFLKKNDKREWESVDPPLFADGLRYLQWGRWICPPGVARSGVKLDTFKDYWPDVTQLTDRSVGGTHYATKVKVVRFWGFGPPAESSWDILSKETRATAEKLKKWLPRAETANGKAPPRSKHFVKVPVKKVAASEVDRDRDAVKKVPPHPDKQKKGAEVPHQQAVEEGLAQLHAAKLIDESPGKRASVIDADTTKAVKDFQKKFDAPHADGIASPPTRKVLRKAVAAVHAGKHPKKPDKKPKIDHFYWLRNRVAPGGTTMLAVHGKNLDVVDAFQLTIIDKKSGRQAVLPLPIVTIAGSGIFPVVLPDDIAVGVELTAKLEGKTNDGTALHATSDVPLHVGAPIAAPVPAGDWPWDEALWTSRMRAIIAELRAEPKPAAPSFHEREITQYGVKEKMLPGDTPVLAVDGTEFGKVAKNSLMKAEIEGTMRLNGRVLNVKTTGNVYDIPVEKVVHGKTVTVYKPDPAKFNPDNSRWEDVTSRAPWGSGSCLPLIPFRTLAVNRDNETHFYRKKAYVEQLDGLVLPDGKTHNGICIIGDCGGMATGAQFDFFVGREDSHIRIPGTPTKCGVASRVVILDDCEAAQKKKKK
jgi:hypothetical protein